MPLTIELFLWVSGVIIAFLLFLISILLTIKSDVSPIGSIAKRIQAKAIDEWFEERGLATVPSQKGKKTTEEHHSLSPEKELERKALVAIGNERGLTESEAIRLKELLEEDARDDFTRGLFNALAFAAIIVAIGVIIKSLSKA